MTESAYAKADGAQLWTIASGSGPPVVLLNGGPGMADYLEPLASLLDDRYRVFRYEQRGCGRSVADEPFELATFIDDIEAVRRHWGISRWFVVGHSWGADLGLAYALTCPDSLLALIGLAGGRIHNDRAWHAEYKANRHRERPVASFTDPNRAVNRALNEDWQAWCRRPQLLADLKHLELPVLFVHGAEDVRPGWPTEQLAGLIPGAVFQRLTGADHYLWRDQPERLSTLVLDFLDRCGPA